MGIYKFKLQMKTVALAALFASASATNGTIAEFDCCQHRGDCPETYPIVDGYNMYYCDYNCMGGTTEGEFEMAVKHTTQLTLFYPWWMKMVVLRNATQNGGKSHTTNGSTVE